MKTRVLVFCCCMMLALTSCAEFSKKKPSDRAKIPVGDRGEIKLDVSKSEANTEPTPDKTQLYEHRRDNNPFRDSSVGLKGSLKF